MILLYTLGDAAKKGEEFFSARRGRDIRHNGLRKRSTIPETTVRFPAPVFWRKMTRPIKKKAELIKGFIIFR
jgi:hypothetical protein